MKWRHLPSSRRMNALIRAKVDAIFLAAHDETVLANLRPACSGNKDSTSASGPNQA